MNPQYFGGWRGWLDHWIAHKLPVPRTLKQRVCDWYENWLVPMEERSQPLPNGEPPSTPEKSAG